MRNCQNCFCIHFTKGSSLQGKNLLPIEPILSLYSRPLFGRDGVLWKANRKWQKLYLFQDLTEIYQMYQAPPLKMTSYVFKGDRVKVFVLFKVRSNSYLPHRLDKGMQKRFGLNASFWYVSVHSKERDYWWSSEKSPLPLQMLQWYFRNTFFDNWKPI